MKIRNYNNIDKSLLQHCFFYKGEEEMPERNSDNQFEQDLWMAEMTICVDMPYMVKGTDKRKSFYQSVALFFGKWWPYDYAEYLEKYNKLIAPYFIDE